MPKRPKSQTRQKGQNPVLAVKAVAMEILGEMGNDHGSAVVTVPDMESDFAQASNGIGIGGSNKWELVMSKGPRPRGDLRHYAIDSKQEVTSKVLAEQTCGFVSAYAAGLGIGAAVLMRYLLSRIGGTKVLPSAQW